jgi:PRTRC genetic system ThiF family protein
MTEKWHYTAPYLLNPQHPVTVQVIGAGGNGSQVLSQLARIDQALKKLGHTGLHVTCFDDDIVTDANLGRQLFSPADLGMNKAVVLVTRLNMFFGTSWKAEPRKFDKKVPAKDRKANITITCVDSVKSRLTIVPLLEPKKGLIQRSLQPFEQGYYWMDLGNSQSAGQFVIGTCQKIKQPKRSETFRPVAELRNIFDKFPSFRTQKTKATGPSCSLAEALKKQDLFINSFLVQTAMATLWKMFREGRIRHHGAFVNLQTLDIAPIAI